LPQDPERTLLCCQSHCIVSNLSNCSFLHRNTVERINLCPSGIKISTSAQKLKTNSVVYVNGKVISVEIILVKESGAGSTGEWWGAEFKCEIIDILYELQCTPTQHNNTNRQKSLKLKNDRDLAKPLAKLTSAVKSQITLLLKLKALESAHYVFGSQNIPQFFVSLCGVPRTVLVLLERLESLKSAYNSQDIWPELRSHHCWELRHNEGVLSPPANGNFLSPLIVLGKS
jgi:hypothetical protein